MKQLFGYFQGYFQEYFQGYFQGNFHGIESNLSSVTLPTSLCVALSDPLLLLLQVQNRIALGIWYLEYFEDKKLGVLLEYSLDWDVEFVVQNCIRQYHDHCHRHLVCNFLHLVFVIWVGVF